MGDFLRKVIKNKGKIVLEARNTENFRLRRAKIEDFIAILILKGPNLGKIAPEGRDFFGGLIFFHFLKSKKNTAMYPCIHVPCIYPCTMYSSIHVFTHVACMHLSMYLPIPTLEAFPFIPTCDPNQVGFHPNLGCSSQIISQPSKDGIVGSSEVRTQLDLHPKFGRSWIFIPSWDANALSFNLRSQVWFHPNAG